MFIRQQLRFALVESLRLWSPWRPTARQVKRYVMNREWGRVFDFTAGCFLPGRSESSEWSE
jgi:hypothetical protein